MTMTYTPDMVRSLIAPHPRDDVWTPRSHLGQVIARAFTHLPYDLALELKDAIQSSAIMESSLSIRVHKMLDEGRYEWQDYGIVGRKVLTTVGVGYIVDAFQNLVELENMKYHGLGTGTTAEAVGDSALVTELTTEYTSDIRATGTTTESAATVYVTVGTNTLDGTPGGALREHGVFSASTSGVLLDRTVYSAITLSSGDSLQSTYSLTCTAGG